MSPQSQSSWSFTIYDPGFPHVPPDVSTPARAKAVVCETMIRTDSNETGIFIAASGTELLRRDGLPNKVVFSDHELKAMTGTLFTHNHPCGLSFSDQDIVTAATAQLMEIRAVAPTYRHIMKPAKSSWPTEAYILREYNGKIRDAHNVVTTLINTGQLQLKYATLEIHHRVWELAAPKLGLIYVREPS